MVLFVYGPLLFEHGLRGNNMEAPLFLCYCGGVFHYLAWAEATSSRARDAGTSWPSRLYFFLGFMTKFVAALFLPVFLGAAALSLGETRSRLRQDFFAWIGGRTPVPRAGCSLVRSTSTCAREKGSGA